MLMHHFNQIFYVTSITLPTIWITDNHDNVPFVSHNLVLLSSFITYHHLFNQSNTTDATTEAGTAYPSGAPEFTPD